VGGIKSRKSELLNENLEKSAKTALLIRLFAVGLSVLIHNNHSAESNAPAASQRLQNKQL
jgi:hypothetical protein